MVLKTNSMNFFLKIDNAFKEWKKIYKNGGIKLLFKKKGFLIIVVLFTFYLIRDSILYLIIPYFAFRSIVGCS